MKNTKRKTILFGLFFLLVLCLVLWAAFRYFQIPIQNENEKKQAFGTIESFNPYKRYLDGIDVIYWINLNRSVERRKEMEKMLSDPVFEGIPNHRFSAVDGKNANIFAMVDFNPKFQNRTKIEYACLLSHLEVIRNFYEDPMKPEVALVLEDDICLDFKKYWNETIQEIIQNAPSDWEVIQLCYFGVRCEALPVKMYDDQTVLYSTGAYLVNRKGAQKIANSYRNGKYELNLDFDISADIYLFQVMKKYAYKYPLFIFKSQNDSTIHSEDVMCHEHSKNVTAKMLEKEVFVE